MYGLQFHIECSPEMIRGWIKDSLNSKEKVERKVAKAVLKRSLSKKNKFFMQSRKVLINLFNIIEDET